MENFLVAAAGVVLQAVAQEAISRTVSSVLGKRKERASQGEYMERLETAVRCMQSVLETTAKAPITEVSLLRDWIELERCYKEAKGVLSKQKQQQQQQEISTQAITTHSSSSSSSPQAQGTSVPRRATIFSIASSSFVGPMKVAEPSRLSCDDIERFERMAGSAQNFLCVVSRRAWLGHRIYFSGPIVSHLFQWEILTHKTLEGSREHSFTIWSIILEGRGVEAELQYRYTDHERTHKSFHLQLRLRLSPSTDIAQVALKCLQSQSLAAKFAFLMSAERAANFGLLLEPATRALLQLARSQDIVCHAPRWRDPQWTSREEVYMKNTRLCRPNAVCCTAAYGYDEEPCAKESQMFPEEVISLGVRCCILGLELTGATVFENQPPQLDMLGLFAPHYMTHVMSYDWRNTYAKSSDLWKSVDSMLEGQKEGVSFNTIARHYSDPIECSIQEAVEKEAEGLFRIDLEKWFRRAAEKAISMDYRAYWFSKHGAAFFRVYDATKKFSMFTF